MFFLSAAGEAFSYLGQVRRPNSGPAGAADVGEQSLPHLLE